MVPYVVGVMHVLFIVLHVLGVCEGARVTAMLMWVQGRCGCSECVYGWHTWFKYFV